MVQTASFYLYKLCDDGIRSACLTTTIDNTCLLFDFVFNRGVWSIPHLPPRAPLSVLARPPVPNNRINHGCLGRRLRHSYGWRPDCICDGNGPRLQSYAAVYGGLQLVANWASEV
jgi:hypothetical protein